MVATHSLRDGQAMLDKSPNFLRFAASQILIHRHECGPVGCVLTCTPFVSVTMQNRTRGQLTAGKPTEPTRVPCQAPAPPVGSVEVNTWPASLTATHSRGDAHEIVSRGESGVTGSAVIAQVLAPPSGFVEISTPLACVPTHRWTDGHATSIIPSGSSNGSRWSISAGDDQVIVDATAKPAKHPSASAIAVNASPLGTMPDKRSWPREVAGHARRPVARARQEETAPLPRLAPRPGFRAGIAPRNKGQRCCSIGAAASSCALPASASRPCQRPSWRPRAVWVVNTLDGTLSRVDPIRNAVTSTVPIGQANCGSGEPPPCSPSS